MRVFSLISPSLAGILFATILQAQVLINLPLTAEDKKKKVIGQYEYRGDEHYALIKLSLLSTGTFSYEMHDFRKNVFSEGKWIQKKDTLILNSYIKSKQIPVKLIYSDDTSSLIEGFKIGIVRNLNGEYMPDGMVNINQDSVKCVPEWGFCTTTYSSIDRIKIVFENGLFSDWINVDQKDYNQIIPVVQTKFLVSTYKEMNDQKYLIWKSGIKWINQ